MTGRNSGVVVGLGEVLWDIFPEGPRFGGAPANFAFHAAQLGKNTALVSAVGQDDLGEQAIQKLTSFGISTDHVQSNHYPTGSVHVELDDRGHAKYRFNEDCAWDHLEWSAELADLALRTSAVCFGTLGQRSLRSGQTIQQFLSLVPEDRLKVYDINLRPPFFSNDIVLRSLQLANVFKLNDDELALVAKIASLSGHPTDQLRQLCEKFDLKLVALTKGSDGATLVTQDEVVDQPGIETTVRDTVGAGDSFTAAVVVGLLNGVSLAQIGVRACRLAAFVCAQSGATPEYDAAQFL